MEAKGNSEQLVEDFFKICIYKKFYFLETLNVNAGMIRTLDLLDLETDSLPLRHKSEN